jgi:hypothetical protein
MHSDALLSHARAILTATPARWLSLMELVPRDLLMRPPADGQWSAAECLHHLLDVELFIFPISRACIPCRTGLPWLRSRCAAAGYFADHDLGGSES